MLAISLSRSVGSGLRRRGGRLWRKAKGAHVRFRDFYVPTENRPSRRLTEAVGTPLVRRNILGSQQFAWQHRWPTKNGMEHV
jgi:hypothetical protein